MMSLKYFCLHKKIQDVAAYAYHVHCDSHNLNLVLKDAMEAVTETGQFYDTIISAHKLLQTAAEDIVQLRRSFDAVLNEASTIASSRRLPRQFLKKRAKKTKAYFNNITEGITLSDPKKRFCSSFLPMMDILSCRLINRFEEKKSVGTSNQVLEPNFLSNASHLDLEDEARKFCNKIF